MNSKKLLGFCLSLIVAGALTASVSSMAQAQGLSPKKRVVATSDYICTPSGFGQRARCYLKD